MENTTTPSIEFKDIHLAVVTPMANERETAARFVREIHAQCAAFSFRSITHYTIFDRMCQDGTDEILRDLREELPHLRVVNASESRSVVDAYLSGYRAALEGKADWILEIDAGFSHDPRDIPRFMSLMLDGYDCIFGSRFCRGGAMIDASLGRRTTSFGGTILANVLLGTQLADMTSGFELFTRGALQAILARGIVSRGPFFQTEIKAFAHRLRICEVPISYRSPTHPVGTGALWDALKGLWRLFWLRLNGKL